MDMEFQQVYEAALRLSPEERLKLIKQLTRSTPSLDARAILDTLNQNAATLRAMGVRRIGVFGSYVRGEAQLNSDIDVLVGMASTSLRTYAQVKEFLENLFGREVDLIEENNIRPELQEQITREVVYAEGL